WRSSSASWVIRWGWPTCGRRFRPTTALRLCRNSRKLFVCPPPISTRKLCARRSIPCSPKKYARKADYLLDLDYPLAWLNEDAFAGQKESEAEADTGEAMKQAGLAGYFTKSQLARGETPATEAGRRYAHSYSPEGGWYVIGIPSPFQVGTAKGTDHATPFSY